MNKQLLQVEGSWVASYMLLLIRQVLDTSGGEKEKKVGITNLKPICLKFPTSWINTIMLVNLIK
jgi:hypothetical protein